jgi:hypothetical protein
MDQGLTITWNTNLIHHQPKTYVIYLRVCFLSDVQFLNCLGNMSWNIISPYFIGCN